MKYFLTFVFLVQFWLVAQSQIPVGSWRMHLPGKYGAHVAWSPSKVYCSTGESLFAYKLSDNSIEKLAKINGLSDFGANAIAFSNDLNLLVIGYDNGNIDIVKGKEIINISDLKKKSLPASKAINHVLFDGKMAYLSCGFGILLLDLEKLEIKDTYIFGPGGTYLQVNSCSVLGNELYAATNNGIFRADKTDPLLVDYSRWKLITNIPNYNKAFRQVISDDNTIYAVYSSPAVAGDSISYLRNGNWSNFRLDENTDIYNLSFSRENIYVSTSNNLKTYDKNFQIKNTLWQYGDYGVAKPRESLIDPSGNLWIADFGNGLIQYHANGSFVKIEPNGPSSSRIKSFFFSGNTLYTAAGGTDISYDNLYNTAEFSTFSGDEWKTYFSWGHSDFMTVRTDPKDQDLIYVSSWGSGIFTYKNGLEVNHYNDANSTLQTAIAGAPYVRVWGMDFDKDGNLWASNSYVNNSLSVLKRNGEWKAFPLRNYIGSELPGDVVVDDLNQIWVVLNKGGGILVLNTNNTPDNTGDDRYLVFKPKDAFGQFVTNVYTLVKDMEGDIWVGTDIGPVVYADPDKVFEGDTEGKQPLLPRPGTDIVDPLLGKEIIRSIAVDGANRKWIGTERGGAFLVSADGDSALLQFNMDNSPILSNTVIAVGIHDKTGEVFFGTDRGIISYRSDATKAGEDFGDVFAFPNPVRPNYHGNITITGLIKDANVKITDIAGNLVYETTTLGGQVVWDGRNLDGRRVASGVYIIFCTNEDGSKTKITKLLFMN